MTITSRLLLGTSLCLLAGCGGKAKDDGGGKSPENSNAPKAEIEIDVVAMTKEFADDESAALKKFKDKWIKVRGVLDAGALNGIASLRGHQIEGELPINVRCTMSLAEAPKVSNLPRFFPITVVGRCHGKGILGVELIDCRVEKVGDDPSIAVSAEDITTEFGKDEDAAEAKYKDKLLRVKGKIKLFKEEEYEVHLSGAKSESSQYVVIARTGMDFKSIVAKHKVGDTVEFYGTASTFFDNELEITHAMLVETKPTQGN